MTIKRMSLLLLATARLTYATSSFHVPCEAPANAAFLDPAPVSISYEFFAFPSYFTNVSNTQNCVQNLRDLTGAPTRIRIGGTTQDRAVFDPLLDAYVSYAVPNYTVAPSNLTYGPSFFRLANTYRGPVIVGLNRGHNDLNNTILAAESATSQIPSLYALELGNEPDLYLRDGQNIATATGNWTPALDAASEATWQAAIGQALNRTSLIQAGNFVSNPPQWSAAELYATEPGSALPYIKTWSHHNYAQGGSSASLPQLINHTAIATNIALYGPDLAVANQTRKPYVIGETNSVSGGGAAAVSPTFGGALWVLDFSLRAAAAGIQRVYYHFGTVGNCAYCWWGNGTVAAPYYGAVAATRAMARGRRIVALDGGQGLCAGYAVYGGDGRLMRVVGYNSEYFNGTGVRTIEEFKFDGLESCERLEGRRLTAPSVVARQEYGQKIEFGGQTFANETCAAQGEEMLEVVAIDNETATLNIAASEAVVLDCVRS